jgi:hypothetical protein
MIVLSLLVKSNRESEMNVERLRKLEAFLRELKLEQFDFVNVVSQWDSDDCGTVCCAMGWTPEVFPELVKWGEVTSIINITDDPDAEEDNYKLLAMTIFKISYIHATGLFTPGYQDLLGPNFKPLEGEATPWEVADLINQYIEVYS